MATGKKVRKGAQKKREVQGERFAAEDERGGRAPSEERDEDVGYRPGAPADAARAAGRTQKRHDRR